MVQGVMATAVTVLWHQKGAMTVREETHRKEVAVYIR